MIGICASDKSPIRFTGLRDRRVEAEERVSLERVGEPVSACSSRGANFNELDFARGA
jgi:hypothetical protein